MLARLESAPHRLKWPVAGLLSLIWFVIYLTTVSPTVNFIDSGELITAVNEPGIAHPPGYPLYVLMGYVATHLLWGDVAWRLNVFSAFWGALAVGAMFVLIFELSNYIYSSARNRTRGRANSPGSRQKGSLQATRRGQQDEGPARLGSQATAALGDTKTPQVDWRSSTTLLFMAAGIGGASLLAASSSFWSRTAQAKMYSLHFFLMCVIWLLALAYRRAHEGGDNLRARRLLVVLALVLGLSLANHLMTLLLGVPVAILLLFGDDMPGRFRSLLRRIPPAAISFALPLLLYLYLPIRSSQNPIMNWGSPDTWGDFWRHVGGWQFRPYLLGDIGGNLQRNTELVSGYAFGQWGVLTVVVVAAALFSAVLLARANLPVALAVAGYALATLIFSLFYGISEIEPYMVPFYAMVVLSIGLSPAAWISLMIPHTRRGGAQPAVRPDFRPLWAAVGLMTLVAVTAAILVYPTQNYSKNRLAEQFVSNVMGDLPPNSILFTDYWDFYAPTYYMQLIQQKRTDITFIDISLLRYPFYTQQLRERYPWLIENSNEIVAEFATEQRKWVNGEPFDSAKLNTAYYDLMTSFVERNSAEHPAYLLMVTPCDPNAPQVCDANNIAPKWYRQTQGLVTKLWAEQPSLSQIPHEPAYILDGILTNPVSMDDVAKINTNLYTDAYRRLAALYGSVNQVEAAQRMADRASQLQAAIDSR
ncbi:MAG: DUF2723 domain-containing protein [Chloroflexota bacterium]